MKKIYLVLSFDHELSLGGIKKGAYAENLFHPTERILEIADSCNIPITLFSDVLCGIKFKEWKGYDFYEPYEAQLQDAIIRGHDVQLHLHPHWINTTYSNGKFYPSDKYSLNDYRDDAYPTNISGIVEQGVNFLNTVCKPINKDYRCIAFRAGGYNLSPSTAKILTALWENGVRIDSTISKGFRFRSDISSVDYSNMPQQANWYIPLQGPLNNASSKGLFEVPIVSVPRTPINNIPFLVKRFIHGSRQPLKTGIGLHNGHTSVLQRLKRLVPFSTWMLSFDDYCRSASNLTNILSTYINKHQNDKVIFASTIAHPKSMGDYNFELMHDFIKGVISNYGDKIVFCKYQDIYDLIGVWNDKKTI